MSMTIRKREAIRRSNLQRPAQNTNAMTDAPAEVDSIFSLKLKSHFQYQTDL